MSFVGREAQLVALDEALQRALDGEIAVTFVTGEPGAGKTALSTEFARRAQDANPDLVYAIGRCDAQHGQGDPYLPFREVLDVLTGDVEGRIEEGAISAENARRVTSVLRSTARTVFQYGPALIEVFVPGAELATRLGGELAKKLGWKRDEPVSHEGFRQEHLQEQYANVLGAVSDERPLLILLDDLHWADEASVSLLFHLGRRLVSRNVLILGTYRAQDVALGRDDGRHPIEPVVNELKRDQGEIELVLDAVDDADRAAFVDDLLDGEPNTLDESFRNQFFERTRGNALFAVELLRVLRERGSLVRDSAGVWQTAGEVDWTGIPARVEGVIAERVGRLDAATRSALATAAVEGDEFTAQVVSEVEGVDLRPLVSSLADLARSHGIVRSQGQESVGGTRLWRYAFSHVLIQEYLYESLDPAEKSFLHEDVARALVSAYGDEVDQISAQLALHFERAGNHQEAIHYCELAAQRAQDAYANTEAVGHLRAALKQIDSGRGSDDVQARGRLLEALGRAESARGSHDAALDAFQQALESELPSRVATARIHRGIGESWQRQQREAETVESLGRALAILSELGEGDGDAPRDESGEEWTREWIDIQLALLWGHYWWNNPDEMEAIDREIREIVDRHGTPEQQARLLRGKTALAFRRSRYLVDADDLDGLREALAATERTGHLPETCESRFQLGFGSLWAGRPADARTHLEQSLDMADRLGIGLMRLLSATYLAVIERFVQDVGKTERLAKEARKIASAAQNPAYEAVADANLAWVALRRGDSDTATALARAAVEQWGKGGGIKYPLQLLARWPLVRILTDRGEPEEAVEHLRAILDPTQKRLSLDLETAAREVLEQFEAEDHERTTGLEAALGAALEIAAEEGYV